ncbi:MAG: hypothetical protein M3173_08520 [Chloroflexota bacterium]|nr:hypothetical protein [Chloroflexota bacterium]
MMGAEAIVELADRGLHGTERLLEHREPSTGVLRDDPRWARYRIILRELGELGREWASVYDNT